MIGCFDDSRTKNTNTVNYGHGVFAQSEKSIIVPLSVLEFLKNSLIQFSIKGRKPKPKESENILKKYWFYWI